MKHKIKFLTIAAIIISLISCKDDCQPNKIGSEKKLSKDDINALFPYREKENLKYLKDRTDSVIFYNIGFVEGYNYVSSQTDCP